MRNRFFIYIAFFIVCNVGFAQSTNQNYVKEIIYSNEGNVSNPNSSKNIITTTYLDGLGRPIQIIEQNASPDNNKNIVTHIEYEKNIGKVKDYLPYATAGNGSDFVADAKTATVSFHTSKDYVEYLGANNPYSEIKLEKSPNARVLETAAPGKEWAIGSGHTIKSEYDFNAANEVKKFVVSTTWDATAERFTNSIVQSGYYPKSALHKTIIKNENWTSGKINTTEEFKGVDGKILLKRAYNYYAVHDTYYAYDFYGNLAYVIPPMAEGTISATNLNNFCYEYIYDKKNRLIEKKLPQKNWEYIVYDNADRIVLSGPVYSPFADGTKGWIFSKYDEMNRVVYTGFYNAGTFTANERKRLQTLVNNQTVLNEKKEGSDNTIDGVAVRYSNSVFPTSSINLLSVNYFDDYKYPNAPTSFPIIEANATTQKVKGLPTGSWVRIITNNAEKNGDLSYTLYNTKYQPIRSYTKNYLGGYIQTDNKVKYNGLVDKTTSTYKKTASTELIKVVDAFTYDDKQRLLTQTQTINSQTPEKIIANVYDELGALRTKNVGGTTGRLQKVDYKYNVRGWLRGINYEESGHNDPDDLFNFIINYDSDGYRVDSEKQYNGGISSVLWKSKQDNILRGYVYDYDHLNRLINAQTLHNPSGGPGLFRSSEYQEGQYYDKNGNIISLYRTGKNENNQKYEIDDLVYTYIGNQLLKVVDETQNPEGFNYGKTIDDDDYAYDTFGNLILDKNKKISKIKYNHLNLPTDIVFDSGTIKYTYDATGTKIKKTVQPNNAALQTTEYQNGFQYVNGKLEFFPHTEGYAKPKTEGGFLYVYQYKDHLGNVRLSYADLNGNGQIDSASEILEEKNYYPFGLQHNGYNEAVKAERSIEAEKYSYNDIEFEDSLGLNMYEMDLRQYDPAIARWVAQDPVIHYDFSPYSAFDNNPAFWADPSGADAVKITDANGNTVGGSFDGKDKDDLYNYLVGNTDNFEAELRDFYSFESNKDENGGGGSSSGNGNGNGGKYNGVNLESIKSYHKETLFSFDFLYNNKLSHREVLELFSVLEGRTDVFNDIMDKISYTGFIPVGLAAKTLISDLKDGNVSTMMAGLLIEVFKQKVGNVSGDNSNIKNKYFNLHKNNPENMQGIYQIYERSGSKILPYGTINVHYYDIYSGKHLGTIN